MLTEMMQICAGFGPVDLIAPNNGDWVSMENFNRCAIVFFKAAGTAGDDPTITVEQATTAAGSGNKALNFRRIDHKQGADLAAVGQFTTVEQTAANTYTDATSAEVAAIWVIDIEASDLDVTNGYKFLQAKVADVGTNSQLGALLYLLYEPRYAEKPLPSALA